MSRKRITTLLLSAILLISGTQAGAVALVDIQRHWAGTAIYTLMEHGLLHGYPDARFRPDHKVTLEMAVVPLYQFAQEQAAATAPEELPATAPVVSPEPESEPASVVAPEAKPVPESVPVQGVYWYSAALDWLSQAGVLTDAAGGSLVPGAVLSRGAFSGLLYRCWQQGLLTLPGEVPAPPLFSDLEGCPDAEAIRFLSSVGVLTGSTGGAFQPDRAMTRAELASILFRLSTYAPSPPPLDLPKRIIISVPYSSQIYPLGAWVGCEPTALYMALKAKGSARGVTLRQFLDGLPHDPSNPARGFVGSPYQVNKKLRTTIYPPILAAYGRGYGADAVDFSDSSIAEFQAELLAGNPIVAYVTLNWKAPVYNTYMIDGAEQTLLLNNHAVLVCGFDSATGAYYISDPYNLNAKDRLADYSYWMDGATFERLYTIRNHAVVVR